MPVHRGHGMQELCRNQTEQVHAHVKRHMKRAWVEKESSDLVFDVGWRRN